MSISPPTAPPKLPGKVVLGLVLSAGLLTLAVSLEVRAYRERTAITVRTAENPAGEPMLQAVPPGSKLPTQEELTPPPEPADSGEMPGFMRSPGGPGMPAGHPGGTRGPGPTDGPVEGPLAHGTPEGPGGPAMAPTAPLTGAALVERGRDLVVNKLKCITCHTVDGKPLLSTTFLHLYGKQSVLTTGAKVTVDDAYIRESILTPDAKVVAGARVKMLSYAGQVTDADIEAITAYIQSLGGEGGGN